MTPRRGEQEGAAVYGLHPVRELLLSGARVRRLVLLSGRKRDELEAVASLARARGIPVDHGERAELDRLAGGGLHQGILALAELPGYVGREAILEGLRPPALLLLLDHVEDPRNLGAVLRTAAATGFGGVFLPRRRAAGLSPGVLKAAAGTAGRVPVAREASFGALLTHLRQAGIWVVAVEAGAPPVWSGFDFTQPTALVLGGEEKGVRPLLRRRCDAAVGLPLAPGVESLNLSVAFGAVAYEIVRQRAAGEGSGRRLSTVT